MNTIITVGNVESDLQPSAKELLNMLQLLADIVSPACEELEAIMQDMNDKDTAIPLPQGQKARVKTKGRPEPSRR